MDSIDITSLKMEKANAILRYRRLQNITTLFRFVEVFLVLIVISRFSTLFPVTFHLSGEYFRGIILRVVSPRFVFVVGNVIIIILFLKSGKFPTQTGDKSSNDLYDEYVGNRELNQKIEIGEETAYEKKQSIAVKKDSYRERKISRSHSENFNHGHGEKARPELRRTVTERRRKSVSEAGAKDDMSSDEFRRTVEAFIARQQRILREEEFLGMY